jgi:hypothetical protein
MVACFNNLFGSFRVVGHEAGICVSVSVTETVTKMTDGTEFDLLGDFPTCRSCSSEILDSCFQGGRSDGVLDSCEGPGALFFRGELFSGFLDLSFSNG